MPVTSVREIHRGGSGYRRAVLSIASLAIATLGYLGALEIAARVFFPAHSAEAARIRSDWTIALQSGVPPSHDRHSVLLVGNSLLQAGVDRKQLNELQQGSTLSVTIMPIENTRYLDWYFGVQRLLAEGSHPQFVVLCLPPVHLISLGTDGVVFARTLMRPADIMRVKQAAGLDWSTTSLYLMASASAWIGDSTEIRNWIRAETVPGMAKLAPYFWQRADPNFHAEITEQMLGLRLTQFSGICARHGCKALLLIPPLVRDRGDGAVAAVALAGRTAGVAVLIPVAPGELGQGYFKDDFHLNQRGAEIFTARLWETLKEITHN